MMIYIFILRNMNFTKKTEKKMTEEYSKYFDLLDKKPFNPIKNKTIELIKEMKKSEIFRLYNFFHSYEQEIEIEYEKSFNLMFNIGCDCNIDENIINQIRRNIKHNKKLISQI